MTVKLAVVMDPIQSINPKKDSTLAMLLAASARNWQLYYIEQKDLYKTGSTARCVTRELTVFDDLNNWFSLGERQDVELHHFDVILMRKDPPFDEMFLYTTFLLESAERQGSLIINRPQSLRDCNEKVFATEFEACCPPVLISAQNKQLKNFYQEYNDIILKPLNGMGGKSIFRVKPQDDNFNVIVETLTNNGQHSIMAQQYLPAIKEGDKRILLINGKPVPYALARIPSVGENRGNLAAGGSGEARTLTERDLWICEQIAPTLIDKGLIFVGIDVIGDYLTEINVTSPTCIREINSQSGTDIGGDLMNEIENMLN